MEVAGASALRRLLWMRVPPVAAGLEHDRLAEVQAALVLQIEVEERQLDRGAIVLRRLRSELDSAERAAVAARPSAVQPRSDDERRLVRGVLLLHRAVHAERAVEILRVEPGGDDQHRVAD